MINAPVEEEFKVTVKGVDHVTGEEFNLLVRSPKGKLVVSDLISKCYPHEGLKRLNGAIEELQGTVDEIVVRKRDYAKLLRRIKNMDVPPENILKKNKEICNLESGLQRLNSLFLSRMEYLAVLKQARKILRRRCRKWIQ